MVVLNAYLGMLMLGLYVGASDIGAYRVAVQISLVSGLAYTSLNMLAGQRFADTPSRSGDHDVASAEFHARIVGSPDSTVADRCARNCGSDVNVV